ncbi:MAG: helix-turn-helix transcriptional regulator [Acidobacteriota bacterium]
MNRVRARRLELHMTQVELATASGITQTAVSDIERGATESPGYETVVRLARALQVPSEELFLVESLAPADTAATPGEAA